MITRVIVNGAQGRMGALTVRTFEQHPQYELVAKVDHHSSLSDAIKKNQPDIVVDFTTAAVAFENANIIIDSGTRAVIGTTGFTPEQIAQLKKNCAEQKLGAIIAPNFSISALVMMRLARECAKYISHVEIVESHHENKADAPSGTAIKTAELINQTRSKTTKIISHELLPGARGADKDGIPIHSIRLPGLLFHQEVIFGSPGETLHLKYNAIDRNAYMPGVLLACEKVMQLNTLIYGLEDLLFSTPL